MSETSRFYHPVTRALHWLSVPLIIFIFITGLDLEGMPRGPEKSAAIALHTSLGATLFLVLVLRLIARKINRPAPLPGFLSDRRRQIARLSHVGIYSLLFVQIFLGDMAMLTVTDLVIWDVITIPTPFERDLDLHHFFEDLHNTLWWGIVALLVVHIGAAISLALTKDPETGNRAWRM